ncbi:MAG: response regulator transcription factor [Clostridium celatum]|nr:response regulator transcription factor [Clostridium celatum]
MELIENLGIDYIRKGIAIEIYDEKKICEFIKAFLDNEGYYTDVAYDGNSAIDKINSKKYDLIILDRMIPYISGEEICEYIRKKSEIPIIMLTARIEDEDRIDGFKLGCDDYICKPFNINELVLRVKAILKRSSSSYNKKIISYGEELEVNTETHEVNVRGEEVILTNTEYKILLTLINNPKKIYSREKLLESTIEGYYEKGDRAIDSHIKNLRQKIEIDSRNPRIIQTVYGVGYRFGL